MLRKKVFPLSLAKHTQQDGGGSGGGREGDWEDGREVDRPFCSSKRMSDYGKDDDDGF